MNNYLGEETYVLIYPENTKSGEYRAGFSTEEFAWLFGEALFGLSRFELQTEGYAVGKCFVFIPEDK